MRFLIAHATASAHTENLLTKPSSFASCSALAFPAVVHEAKGAAIDLDDSWKVLQVKLNMTHLTIT